MTYTERWYGRIIKRMDSWNENEHPRDKDGRFASSSSVGKKIEEKDLWEKADKVGVSVSSDLSGLDFGVVSDAMDKAKKVVDDFPILKNVVEIEKSGNGEGYEGGVSWFDFKIGMPCSVWGSSEKLDKHYGNDSEVGFMHPAGTNGTDVMYHEMGHMLERAMIEVFSKSESDKVKDWNSGKYADVILKRAIGNASKISGKKDKELIREVSRYAQHGNQELFAECICDYYANGEKAAELSKAVYRQLKAAIGKKKRVK